MEFKFDKRKRSVVYEEQQCITLSTLSDILVEDTEEFNLVLSTDDSLVMLSPASAVVYILDNDRELS